MTVTYTVLTAHSLGCDERDPNCASTIDIIAYYTPAFLALVGGELSAVEDRAFYSVHIANQALRNSMLPPHMRYRLIDSSVISYQERDSLKSDLVYLRSLPHYQATRKSLAADVGLFFLGTQGYGGYAYSNMGTGVPTLIVASLSSMGITRPTTLRVAGPPLKHRPMNSAISWALSTWRRNFKIPERQITPTITRSLYIGVIMPMVAPSVSMGSSSSR